MVSTFPYLSDVSVSPVSRWIVGVERIKVDLGHRSIHPFRPSEHANERTKSRRGKLGPKFL